MADEKITDLASLTATNLAAGDEFVVVDVSDTTMAASGTNKSLALSELREYFKPEYNASVTSQGPGFATDTYLTGSDILIPGGRLQAKSMYRCYFTATKTTGGSATPIINIRFGTNGTTADTSRGTLTYSAGSGAVDDCLWTILATFRTVGAGSSAVLHTVGSIVHRLDITGFVTIGSESEVATSAGFDSTVASSIIGLSVNGGSSAAWTVTLVQAELFNLV